MHLISLWRMDANVDFTWRICFNLYARWSDFLEAKMLAHVIKFENCFTLSIRIKGFCIVIYDVNPLIANPTKWPNTLKQFVGNWFDCVWPFYEIGTQRVKKYRHFKVPMSTFVFLILLTKKVWVDNNENYVKMAIMLKPISEVSNVKFQIIVLFYFLIPWMRLVLLIFFVRGARRS